MKDEYIQYKAAEKESGKSAGRMRESWAQRY
jgi:hypothetical protein